ncbi:hypothetical protein [Hymenobacter profundi]|uniref:Uncharacterized protein n=1 Tax=Hymenobacter profundi TaxID=1982110 RepID=A0ABS6WZJ4_9BACT|nr:hypothetical protein [Hymenobacter profundi]MBW3128854.1 hypothetical protein [Hymenobacter profundi]
MFYDILRPIKADDPLAQLFNRYQQGLSTIEIVFTPRETMRECREAFETDKRKPTSKHSMARQAKVFYELTVLGNALRGIHRSVVGAVALLEDFFTTYQGDLQRYAIENRLASLEKYGSDEDDDWQETGELDEEGNPQWQAVYKDDPASLTYYTLHHELGAFFHGHETRGEYIGTSGPEDFAAYTQAVATQTDVSLRKMLGRSPGNTELTVYQQGENGEMQPLSLADQIEDELNEDIENARLADTFTSILTLGVGAAQLYERLPSDTAAEYRALLGLLRLMLDVVRPNT